MVSTTGAHGNRDHPCAFWKDLPGQPRREYLDVFIFHQLWSSELSVRGQLYVSVTVNLNVLLLPWHLSPPQERVMLKLWDSLKGTSEIRTTDSKWMGFATLNAEILKNRTTKTFRYQPVALCLHERLSKVVTVNAQWCIVKLNPCDGHWLSPKETQATLVLLWPYFSLLLQLNSPVFSARLKSVWGGGVTHKMVLSKSETYQTW